VAILLRKAVGCDFFSFFIIYDFVRHEHDVLELLQQPLCAVCLCGLRSLLKSVAIAIELRFRVKKAFELRK
jgi:hypothetical protein